MNRTDTVPAADDGVDDAPDDPKKHSRANAAEIAAWVLLAVLTIWVLTGTVGHRYDRRPLVGDQASNIMQMVSLAHDGNDLSYDERDLDRWRALHWTDDPHGLYFQRHGDGWAFAKPYGYSLVLAASYRVLGSPTGVAWANSALLVAMLGVAIATLRLHLRGPAVPLVTAAFLFASNLYFHAYPAVLDLFTAVGVGVGVYALLRALRDNSWVWAAVGFAASGFMVAEKVTLFVALVPLLVLALWRAPWGRRVALGTTMVAAFVLSIAPYLHYSDGRSWSAYGGERYYAQGLVPWDPDATDVPLRVDSDDTFSVEYVWSKISSPSSWADSAQSAVYYVVGRHTGLVAWFPIALLIVALTLARWSNLAGEANLSGEAKAVLVGLGLYVAVYVALFPDNYYGGGQAIGNRYFLQVAPLALGLAAAARLPSRQLVAASALAAVLSIGFMWPHHNQPTWAFIDLDRTSWAQRILPFETNQIGTPYWECGFGVCNEVTIAERDRRER